MVKGYKDNENLKLIIVLISLSATVNFLENFVPFPIPVPGGKWGFSNAFVLYAIVNGGLGMGLLIAVGKSVIGAILSGRFFSLPFILGISGVSISTIVVYLVLMLTRGRVGYVGLSVLGAFVNNLIQLSILVFLLKNRFVLYQLPYFSILGTVSGTVNAFIAYEMGRRIP